MQQQSLVPSAQSSSLDELIRKARRLALASRAASSIRAYGSDIRDVKDWLRAHGFDSITPEVVALYLADHADTLAPATLARRLTSITIAGNHTSAGLSPASMRQPLVAAVMQGIRRTRGIAPHPKDPLVLVDVQRLVAACGDDLRSIRDKAVLLFSFASAFRRSETVRIRVEDIEFCREGAIVHLDRSKTNQEGAREHVGLPLGKDPATCPVVALKRWLEASALTSGPLFVSIDRFGRLAKRPMHPESVAMIVKARARLAGLNPDLLGAHSLRAGHVTEGHLRGMSDRALMRQTRHRSAKSLDRYTRPKGVFLENAAAGIGL